MTRLKRWVLAFGCSSLFLLSLMTDIIKGQPEVAYHSKVGALATWPALVLDWAILTLVIAQMFRLTAFGNRGRAWLAVALPVLVLFGNRLLLGSMVAKFRKWSSVSTAVLADSDTSLSLHVCLVLVLAWAAFVFLLYRRGGRPFRWSMHLGSIALIAGALLGGITVYDLGQAIVRRSGDAHFAPMHPRDSAAQAAHPRLIWVLMDELSYKQALGDRPADLRMPNLDTLTQRSTIFTDVQPVGYYTELAVPSLLIGQKLSDPKYRGVRDTSFYFEQDHRREFFTGQATVMGDAERQHWNVAVDGWYIPYCTKFRGMLQRCNWRLSETKNPMRTDFGLLTNMLAPFRQSVRAWHDPPLLTVQAEDQEHVLQTGLQYINDPLLDFVYVHIPVPHPPAIYDRHTGKTDLSLDHSYEDALAHADAVIGDLMQAAQTSPRWNETSIIINGDHSWRTPLWKTGNGWTAEDQRISQGKFDERPLVLVHASGQETPEVVTQPVSVLKVHDIAEAVIHTGKPAW